MNAAGEARVVGDQNLAGRFFILIYPNILSFNRLEDVLQALHKIFQTDKRVVLVGREGVGKSTLAREYTRRFGEKYRTVAWINAATDETFLADLCGILQEFALPVDMAQGVMGLFQTLHNYLNEQRLPLLVLDHLPFAFRVQDSSEQLPLSYDSLLITHLETPSSELPRLELTGLEAQDGARLVLYQAGLLAEQETLDVVGNELRMEALELAREMQGSPIALRLAAGYLCQSGSSTRDYLDLFRGYPVSLQLHRSEQQELEVACEICLTWIEQMHPGAREILRTCALFLPDAIPGALWQQEEEEKIAQQKETIQLLAAVGLLDVSKDGAMLSMHPLIQQLTRQFYGLDEQPQQQQQAERSLRCLQRLLPTLGEETLSARLRIVGHIQQMANLSKRWEINSAEVADVFGWATEQLWEQRMLNQAEKLLKRALEIWEKAPGISQLTIATTLEKLAALNGQLGNYAEAQALAHRTIASTMAAKGINHPDVLIALKQLGQYYEAQNKENEAEACYEKVIEIGEMLRQRHHPVYSEAKYHLALLRVKQGQFEQAEDLLRRVCVVWSRILGETHHSTVEARLKLAEVAAHLKHWERANDSYQQILPVYAEALGKENPLVLGHMERAAMVMFHLGKLEEAKDTWQSVLAVRERTGGGALPESVSCLNGLARVALAEGKRVEALEMLERAQLYGAERDEAGSLEWAEMLETMAEVYEAGQEYRQAERAARKALEMRERILGNKHLDLIENLSTLARLDRKLGEVEEAEKLLLHVLYIYQRENKPEDMRLDLVLKSLAEIEAERERFVAAKMYLQRIRAIRELTLNEDDPRIQEIRQMLAENASMLDLQT